MSRWRSAVWSSVSPALMPARPALRPMLPPLPPRTVPPVSTRAPPDTSRTVPGAANTLRCELSVMLPPAVPAPEPAPSIWALTQAPEASSVTPLATVTSPVSSVCAVRLPPGRRTELPSTTWPVCEFSVRLPSLGNVSCPTGCPGSCSVSVRSFTVLMTMLPKPLASSCAADRADCQPLAGAGAVAEANRPSQVGPLSDTGFAVMFSEPSTAPR